MAKVNGKHSELIKMFDSLSGTKGTWEVWNDVVTMIAISISNAFDNTERKKVRESQYLNIVKKYTPQEQKIITMIFVEITKKLELNPDQDLLGSLYMDLNMGNKVSGQFFTPYSVCQAMAKVTFNKAYAQKLIENNGYIKVNEPSCGAGANIIAIANEMKKLGVDYQNSVLFVAQDLSLLTALMCYVQLSLIGCAAIVVVGDTLQKPFVINTQTEIELSESVWLTPMYYNENWCIRRNAKLLDELLIGKDKKYAAS